MFGVPADGDALSLFSGKATRPRQIVSLNGADSFATTLVTERDRAGRCCEAEGNDIDGNPIGTGRAEKRARE